MIRPFGYFKHHCYFTDFKLFWIWCPNLSFTKVDDYDLYALLYAGAEAGQFIGNLTAAESFVHDKTVIQQKYDKLCKEYDELQSEYNEMLDYYNED